MRNPSDEQFLRAWATAFEKYGNKATTSDIWAISAELEKQLPEKEENNA